MRRTAGALALLMVACGGRLVATSPAVDAGASVDAGEEAGSEQDASAGADAADATDATDGAEGGPKLTPVSVAIGATFACAALSDGSVWCWGGNEHAQLGMPPGGTSTLPLRIAGVVGATRVTAGEAHACALLATGDVTCWGQGGRLGDGSTFDSPTPVPAFGLTGIATIVSSFDHTCAVEIAGRSYCWGKNWNGGLGDGTVADHLLPTLTSMAPIAKTVTTGKGHTCATTQNAEVWCWGTDGQLAAGNNTNLLPHALPNVLATEVAVGMNYSCALYSGSVACWGAIPGTFIPKWPPVAVASPVGFKALAGSRTHACGLDSVGQAWCWGMGLGPALGDGTETYLREAPTVPATGLTGATTLACGWYSTCAIVGKGVKCWGDNAYGQIGDGTTVRRLTPVDVVGLP